MLESRCFIEANPLSAEEERIPLDDLTSRKLWPINSYRRGQ